MIPIKFSGLIIQFIARCVEIKIYKGANLSIYNRCCLFKIYLRLWINISSEIQETVWNYFLNSRWQVSSHSSLLFLPRDSQHLMSSKMRIISIILWRRSNKSLQEVGQQPIFHIEQQTWYPNDLESQEFERELVIWETLFTLRWLILIV